MKTVSLLTFTTRDYLPVARAVDQTLKVLADRVNITKVFWFSNRPYPKACAVPVDWHYIHTISQANWPFDVNRVTMELLPKVLDTDFSMMIHDDGFAVNAGAWTDEFFEYDYIGARWWFRQHPYNVGNGGFSLRSRKLYDAIRSLPIPPDVRSVEFFPGIEPEDHIICVLYRQQLEEQFGIKFAPPELADRFSIENFWQDRPCPWLGLSLGFHGRSGIHRYYGIDWL